jgi:predicted dehydrogenase
MILALVGSSIPAVVRARGELDPRSGQPLRAEIDLSFDSGPQCSVHLSSGRRPVRKLTVVFERGTAVFDDAVSPGELLISNQVAPAGNADQGTWERRQTQAFEPLVRESLHFVRCVDTGQQPLTGAAHACQVTELVEHADRLVRKEGAGSQIRATSCFY